MILMSNDFNTSVKVFVKMYNTMYSMQLYQGQCEGGIRSLITFIVVIKMCAMQI